MLRLHERPLSDIFLDFYVRYCSHEYIYTIEITIVESDVSDCLYMTISEIAKFDVLV